MLEHPGNNKQSTFWVEGFVFEKIWKTNHPKKKKNEFNSEAYKLRALVQVITEHWIRKIMRSVIKHMHEWTKIRSVLLLYRIVVQKFSAKLQLAAVHRCFLFMCFSVGLHSVTPPPPWMENDLNNEKWMLRHTLLTDSHSKRCVCLLEKGNNENLVINSDKHY